MIETAHALATIFPARAIRTPRLREPDRRGGRLWGERGAELCDGLLVLSRRSFELHLDVHVDQLSSWFPAAHQKHTGVSVDAAKLREHVDTLRGWHSGSVAARAR